jgi:hypothetical protein
VLVLERSLFDPFGQLFLAGRGLADRPPGRHGPSVRHWLLADRPRTGRGLSVIRSALLEVFFGPSARDPQTVRLVPRKAAKSFAS